MDVSTRIHYIPQAGKETLQEYIQRFIDLVIQATGTDSTACTSQVIIVFLIIHLLNKEIKRHVAAAKTIQTLRHAITLAQETEIKLKMFLAFNDDDPSVIQFSSIPESDSVVMTIKGQNAQVINQDLTACISRLNLKAKFTCYKCGGKGHLITGCPHKGNVASTQNQPSRAAKPY